MNPHRIIIYNDEKAEAAHRWANEHCPLHAAEPDSFSWEGYAGFNRPIYYFWFTDEQEAIMFSLRWA